MQLSEHFSLEELTASETAERNGIDNTPPEAVLANLRVLAAGLEQVRGALGGRAIHVNSGYRGPKLNAAIGGATHSAHLDGLAADIIVPAFGTPYEVCHAIAASGIGYDKLIHEFGKWTHVAFPAPGQPARKRLLTIWTAARGYERGILAKLGDTATA